MNQQAGDGWNERLKVAQRLIYGDDVPALDETVLGGHASSRCYVRYRELDLNPRFAPARFIVMVLPVDSLAADEGSSEGEPPAELPFLNVQRYLSRCGLPVPDVYGVDMTAGVVALEDLGDTTFERHIAALDQDGQRAAYRRAVDLLVELQQGCADRSTADAAACIAFQRGFDRALLRWELDHFAEWALSLGSPNALSAAERALLTRAFDPLVEELLDMPQVFVHRDYQSRNLMVDGQAQLHLIDFQDALLGPQTYDLAALLCDSYVALDEATQAELLAYYAAKVGRPLAETARAFWAVAAHRKLKDTGRFFFIDRVRGNPSFLAHVPQSLRYVDRALAQLSMHELRQLIGQRFPGYPDAVPVPPAV